MVKQIYRSRKNRVIAGVCGGFAEYFRVDPAIVRLIWLLFTLFGGSGIVAYIIAYFLIKDEFEIESGQNIANQLQRDKSYVLWAILLLIVGMILFVQHFSVFRLIWQSYWGNWFNTMFGLLIIVAGAVLLFQKRNAITALFQQNEFAIFRLSSSDRKVAGVCGGIAETLEIDSTIVRLIWILFTIFSFGLGFGIYILLALIMPGTNQKNNPL